MAGNVVPASIRTIDGSAWTAISWLNTNAPEDGREYKTDIATNGAIWIAAWTSNDGSVLVTRSTDDGVNWSEPETLDTPDTFGVFPAVTTDGSQWALAWTSYNSPGPEADYDVACARSSDGGLTWSAPETMLTSAAADSASDESPAVATDGAGTWITLWHASDQWGAAPTGIHPNIFASVASVCGGACDDGNPCTQDSCAIEGGCIHLDAPALSCRAGSKGSLLVQDGTLSWKISGVAATSQAEFGDPTDTAAYALCVYDETGTRTGLEVPAAGTCGGRPCWKAVSTKGYGFKDKAGASDGVKSISLKGSADAKTKIVFKAFGASLPATSLPLSGSVAVQLHNSSTGLCWESVFTGADIRSDGADGKFQAKAK